MPAIYPVASTRISDSLIRARLLSQFEFDQQEIVRLQDQISTGYRISTPSQDAPSAIRAITLQRLLEQKQQARVNLNTTDSFVGATDTTLVGATDLLSHARTVAMRAISSTTTPEQREILRSEIQDVIKQFLDIGNRKFRGRYLFSGSETAEAPFAQEGQYVVYEGNESQYRNFIDVDFLADTNVTGAQAFGALSARVEGITDLDPVLNENTRLADLRGGRGITKGSFLVSDGVSTKTIDISSAETIGDVMELIAANPPTGRDLNVSLSGHSITIDLDDAGGGNLTIQEVTGGSTASELGILEDSGVATAPLVGDDLNVKLVPTTQLRDILGTRAYAHAAFAGGNNDLFIEAVNNGTAYNNTQIRFVNGAVGDSATATYNAGTNVLTVQISSAVTRAITAVNAINASGVFSARLDIRDDTHNDGSDVLTTATFTTAGGSGENLDLSSGVQIVNGGQTFVLTFDGLETIEDLLNEFNQSDAQVVATINDDGTGINVRTRLSGADFQIGENGGETATQLGIRSFAAETYLTELNYGRGVDQATGNELTIVRRDGVSFGVDISTAETIGDVLDLINNHPTNVGNAVTARLAVIGNGIELVDPNAAGASNLTILRGSSFATWGLGLIPHGQDQVVAPTPAVGQPQILTGTDPNPLETGGIFNSLIRLDLALLNFSLPEIERATASLDDNFIDLAFVQAELGSKANSLETLKYRIEREDIEIQATLSQEIDTDMFRAISDLNTRQANLQATLQLIGSSIRMTVLNYL